MPGTKEHASRTTRMHSARQSQVHHSVIMMMMPPQGGTGNSDIVACYRLSTYICFSKATAEKHLPMRDGSPAPLR